MLERLIQFWLQQRGAVELAPVLAVLTVLAATNALATISAYDPMNYSGGSGSINNNTAVTATGTAGLTTAGGFSGNWTVGAQLSSSTTQMAYTNGSILATANNKVYEGNNGAGRAFESFTTPLSSGTKWISFLYKVAAANGGANFNGIYFPNGGTGLYVGNGLNPISPTTGALGIGSINTVGTDATAPANNATLLGANNTFVETYGNTYLVAIQIAFNTSGANDTVQVYINPVVQTTAPGSATYTVSTFDVGTITGIGLQYQGTAAVQYLDEVRVGDSFADVMGLGAGGGVNATPTNIVTSVSGNQLTLMWPLDHTGWTLQSQTNSAAVGLGATWYDVTGSTATNQMTFTMALANPAVFYRMKY